RIHEAPFHIVPYARPPRRVLPGTAPLVHQLAEDGRENVGKTVEPGLRERIAGAAVLESGMAEAIICGALLRVLEHVIGLVDRLEPRFRFLAAVFPVGMMFFRHSAICGLDRGVVRAARDAQQFIIVLLDHYPSPLRDTGSGAAPGENRGPRPIIIPCSLRRPRRIPRRRPLPGSRPALPTGRTCRHPGRRQLRSRPAAPCTWPRRASSRPGSALQSSAAFRRRRPSRPRPWPPRAPSRSRT